jgi:hypothetical protein
MAERLPATQVARFQSLVPAGPTIGVEKFQKVVKKLSKSCQKNVKKFSKLSRNCQKGKWSKSAF